MINRSFVAAAFASVALLTASVTLAGRTAEAARPRRPSIGAATLSPSRLSGAGGTVNVRVLIKSNSATLGSVTASSTMAGASPSASSTLLSSDGRYYNGSVRIAANPRRKRATADVFVEVQSSAGRVRKRVGRVKLDKGGTIDDSTPPPPPNI